MLNWNMFLNLFVSLFVCFVSVSRSFPLDNAETEFDSRRVLENPELFDGDILLDSKNRFGVKHNKWPGGMIPFVYNDDLPMKMRIVIEEAMTYISSKTCIKFKPRTGEASYVAFVNGKGCTSYVGHIGRAGQQISMGKGCDSLGIATHEIMHAIGFHHHQNRPDRDDYIEIKWENVDPKYKSIFNKLSWKNAVVFTPFDFQSLMMYTGNAFAKAYNLKTMVSKVPGVVVSDKGKDRMTDWDIYSINKLYECLR